MIILDTHIFVGFVEGSRKLSVGEIYCIEQAIHNADAFVSIISIWEIAMLIRKGKIELPQNCKDWVGETLHKSEISVLPITTNIAIESCNLPGNFHKDPSDQIIVATARTHKAELITHDRKIIEYGQKGNVRLWTEDH